MPDKIIMLAAFSSIAQMVWSAKGFINLVWVQLHNMLHAKGCWVGEFTCDYVDESDIINLSFRWFYYVSARILKQVLFHLSHRE